MRRRMGIRVCLAGAMALGLAGCAKHSPDMSPSQVPLVFEAPVVGTQSKAVAGDIASTYDVAENFRVWGWLSFSDIECSNFTSDGTTPNGQEYFANVKSFHDGSISEHTDYWKLTPAYYWPKASEARLTIHALSPYDVYSDIPAESDCNSINHYWQWSDNENKNVGFVVNDFTVKDNPAQQYDLLYSDFTFNAKWSDYSGDPYDEPSDPGYIYNGINVKFNHALSSVQVAVKQDIDYEVYGSRLRLFLTGVKLKNAFKTGTFVENRKDNSYWGSGTKPNGFANAQPNAYKILTGDKRGPKWISHKTEKDEYLLYSKGWVKLETSPGVWTEQVSDIPMITNGTWHVARNVQIKRGLEIVFRKDMDWVDIRGHIKGTVPYERGKEFDVTPTGSDISILDDGTYDILLNPTLIDGVAKARITPPQPDSYYQDYIVASPWSIHHTSGYKLLTTSHTLKEQDAWGNYFVGGQNLLVIPQKLRHNGAGESGNDVTLELKYVIKYAEVDIEKTVNVPLYNVGGVTEWEPGKRYIYSFTFTMDKIILDPIINTDWTEVSVN